MQPGFRDHLQSQIRYLQTFSCVIVFLNHKLSRTRFLSVEREFPNNLKLKILGNKNLSTKSLKRLETKPRAWPTELKVFTVALENCKKSLLEHFTEKPILLDFENLSTSTSCPFIVHLFQEYLVLNI